MPENGDFFSAPFCSRSLEHFARWVQSSSVDAKQLPPHISVILAAQSLLSRLVVVEVIVAFVLGPIKWNFNATVIKVTQYSRKEGLQCNLSISVQTPFVRNVYHNFKMLKFFSDHILR